MTHFQQCCQTLGERISYYDADRPAMEAGMLHAKLRLWRFNNALDKHWRIVMQIAGIQGTRRGKMCKLDRTMWMKRRVSKAQSLAWVKKAAVRMSLITSLTTSSVYLRSIQWLKLQNEWRGYFILCVSQCMNIISHFLEHPPPSSSSTPYHAVSFSPQAPSANPYPSSTPSRVLADPQPY